MPWQTFSISDTRAIVTMGLIVTMLSKREYHGRVRPCRRRQKVIRMTEEERLELEVNAKMDQVMAALDSHHDVIKQIANNAEGDYAVDEVRIIRMVTHAVLGMIHLQRARRYE